MQTQTRASSQESPAPTAAQESSGRRVDVPLILLVDDEEPILETLVMIVEDMGYETAQAANGEEALRSAQTHWPSLIITDMMMPRLDGAQFIAALRQGAQANGKPLPPIILLTAGMSPRVDQVGASTILTKPFLIEDLEAIIRQYLP